MAWGSLRSCMREPARCRRDRALQSGLIDRSGRQLAISRAAGFSGRSASKLQSPGTPTPDIVNHVGGTLLLRANDQLGVLPWLHETGWRE